MAGEFDPYYEWLGIPPKDQPPNHYRLLGIELFEPNLNVIERAADRQMGHVRSYQSGKRSKDSQRLLNELSAAKVCLLSSPKRTAYDEQLRAKLASQTQPDSGFPTDMSIPELPPGIPGDAPISNPAPTPFTPADSVMPAGPEIEIRHPRKELHPRKESALPTSQPQPPSKKSNWIVAGGVAVVLIGIVSVFLGGKYLGSGSKGPTVSANGNSGTTPGTSTGVPADSSSPDKQNGGKKEGKPAKDQDADVPALADLSNIPAINESLSEVTDPSLPGSAMVPGPVRKTITSAAGLINNQLAFCQTLPWTQFDETNRALRLQGYRIARCRPFMAKGEWRVAAIWLRDGLPYRIVGLTDSATVMQADQALRDKGFMPVDVVGAKDGLLELFFAVWVRPQSSVGASALTLGVAADEYDASKERMLRDGYRPTVHVPYFDTAGKAKYCDLWIKPSTERRDSFWSGDKDLASIQLDRDALQTDVAVTTNPKDGSLLYSGTQWLDAKDTVKTFIGISPDALLAAAGQQITAGFVPAILSVAGPANGDLVSVSIWRPANQAQTTLELARVAPANHASPTTSETPAPPERALRFAGKGSIELRNPGTTNISQDFTIETWLRFNESAFGVVNILCGTAAYKGLHPEVTTTMKGWMAGIKPARSDATTKSQFIFQWADAGGQTQNQSAEIPAFDDKWHHLALCNRGANGSWELVGYIDGKEALRFKWADSKDTASPVGFYLGRPQWVAATRSSLQGLIRALRLSSGLRYQQNFEPETRWTADDQTVALLDFSGSNPTEIADLSTSRQPAAIVGANWSDLEGNLLAGATAESPAVPLERLKPPANIEAELAKVRELFKSEMAAAKDPLALVALSEKVLTQATGEQDSALQYALFSESRRLAVDGLDWNVASRTIDGLSSRFQVDPWSLRAEVLSGLAKKVKAPSDRKILAEKALSQAESALTEGATDSVDSLLSSATSLAPRGERELVREVTDLRKRLTEEKKVQQLVRDARAKLAESPTDAPANESLGKYLCFSKDDWETGLGHLAKGSTGKLTSVARNDQLEPTGAAERLAVADGWYDISKSATDVAIKGGAANRALHWYQLAAPELSGAKKTQVDKQIEELSKSASAPRSKAKFAWLEGEPGVALELRGHTGEVTSLAVSRFGRFLISGSLDDTIRVWDLSTGKMTGQISSGTGDVSAMLLSPNDKTVAIPVVAAGAYSIGLLNLQSRQPVGSIKADAPARQLAGSQDWRRVLYAKNQAGQGNLLIYDLINMSLVAPLSCPGTPVQVAVSRTGRFMAAADDNNVVYAWDMQSGKAVVPLTGHNEAVSAVAFAPNERQLVSCSYRNVICWDLAKGVEEHRIPTQDRGAYSVAYSPDGTRLLVSGSTLEVSVYNAQGGTFIAQLQAPAGGNGSATRAMVSFADGRAAANVGADGLIRIWRLPQ